jgi:hypothetical protein
MNAILTPNGEYTATSFTGTNGTWKLTESQSNGKALATLDTFSNGKGEYVTKRRLEIYEWAEAGAIKAA